MHVKHLAYAWHIVSTQCISLSSQRTLRKLVVCDQRIKIGLEEKS